MVWHTEVTQASATPLKQPTKESFKELLRAYWLIYCQRSSIHGIRYLYDPNVRNAERIVWVTLVITSIALTAVAYLAIAGRFSSKVMQTVVENSQYPVFLVPFPAIAVCPRNRLNWSKLAAAKEHFLSKNASKSLEKNFVTFVGKLEQIRFGRFEHLFNLEDLNLEMLNFLDVTDVARFMSFSCDELFINSSCRWRRQSFVCCERFILEKTELGMCYVFNSNISKESRNLHRNTSSLYYPLRNSKAGEGSGLVVESILDSKLERPNAMLTDSIFVMVKGVEQWTSAVYTIPANTESYINIRPEVTETDASTRNVLPELRNCIFDDEREHRLYKKIEGLAYHQDNCLNVCHEEHLINYCNCTLPLFFPVNNKGARTCMPADFLCMVKNNDVFSYEKRRREDAFIRNLKAGMTCPCLTSCSSIEYFTSLTTVPIAKGELPNDPDKGLIKLDIHFQAEVMIKYRTSLEFTVIDLIASFGGIIGLCLGASMVSIVELLYHLTFGFVSYLNDHDYFTPCKRKVTHFLKKLFGHQEDTVIEIEPIPRLALNQQKIAWQ